MTILAFPNAALTRQSEMVVISAYVTAATSIYANPAHYAKIALINITESLFSPSILIFLWSFWLQDESATKPVLILQ